MWQKIVEKLQMLPHPEGGFYSEVYRSKLSIPGMNRNLITAIYFLLPSDQVSKFHRIKSDELWFFHSGSPLIVHTLVDGKHKEILLGNNLLNEERPQALVEGGTIFGSSVVLKDSYSLVSCVVAPGFDFQDFKLFSFDELINEFPDCEEIISYLT